MLVTGSWAMGSVSSFYNDVTIIAIKRTYTLRSEREGLIPVKDNEIFVFNPFDPAIRTIQFLMRSSVKVLAILLENIAS